MPAPKKREDCNVCLYVLTCLITGERYLGKTIPKGHAYKAACKKRWQKHESRAFCEVEKTAEWTLYQRIREHGSKSFRVDLLEIVRGQNNASKRESELINSGEYLLNTHKKGRNVAISTQ